MALRAVKTELRPDERLSVTRTESPGREILYREMWDYVRETGGLKFCLGVTAATTASVTWLLVAGGRLAAFAAGAFAALVPALILYLVIVYGEFGPRLAGVGAEKETLKLLRRHAGKELWLVVPHVRFKQAADVDMVVVTPHAVLAMEVKWHGKFRPLQKIKSSVWLTAVRSRNLQTLLRDLGLPESVPVLPVLAVWGPASDLIAGGVRKYAGVTVVDAHQPDLWLPLLGTGRVSADTAALVAQLLEQHALTLAA